MLLSFLFFFRNIFLFHFIFFFLLPTLLFHFVRHLFVLSKKNCLFVFVSHRESFEPISPSLLLVFCLLFSYFFVTVTGQDKQKKNIYGIGLVLSFVNIYVVIHHLVTLQTRSSTINSTSASKPCARSQITKRRKQKM